MPDRFEGHPQELAAYKAGQIDQRLDNFDEHFKVVNGSISKSAAALEELARAVVALDTRVKIAFRVSGAAAGVIVSVIAIANFLTSH